MTSQLSQLNPRAFGITIGIRRAYEVVIYPLSFGDELKLIDLLSKSLVQFISLPKEEQTDITLVRIATDFLKENLAEVIDLVIDKDEWLVTGEGKDFLSCVDNYQLLDIVEAIYHMNFGDEVQKKAKEMAQNISQIMRSRKMMIPPSQQPN